MSLLEILSKSAFCTGKPTTMFFILARYFWFCSKSNIKESDIWFSSRTFFLISELVYPGMYSLTGVKEITALVPPIKIIIEDSTKTKTLILEALNVNLSSKFSLFKITKRYFAFHFFQKFLFSL